MSGATLTASKLDRAVQCPASIALPQASEQSEQATRGKAIHRFLELLARGHERTAALAEIQQEHRPICEQLDVGPLDETARPELALAWDPATGAGRVLKDYGERKWGEIAGTADLVTLTASRVRVIDYKTGARSHDLPAPAFNLQLRFLALAAARAFGRLGAEVEILHIHEDGSTHADKASIEPWDLDEIEMQVREIAQRVARVRAKLLRGEVPNVAEGPWCRYCPATIHCPAKKQLVQMLAAEPVGLAADIERRLTPEQVGRAWRNLRAAEAMFNAVRARVYSYIEQAGEVDLGDGFAVGRRVTQRRELDGAVVYDTMTKLHGAEIARQAVTLDATQKGIADALRPLAGRGELAALKRMVVEEIERAGGVRLRESFRIEEYRRERSVSLSQPAPDEAREDAISEGDAAADLVEAAIEYQSAAVAKAIDAMTPQTAKDPSALAELSSLIEALPETEQGLAFKAMQDRRHALLTTKPPVVR